MSELYRVYGFYEPMEKIIIEADSEEEAMEISESEGFYPVFANVEGEEF